MFIKIIPLLCHRPTAQSFIKLSKVVEDSGILLFTTVFVGLENTGTASKRATAHVRDGSGNPFGGTSKRLQRTARPNAGITTFGERMGTHWGTPKITKDK